MQSHPIFTATQAAIGVVSAHRFVTHTGAQAGAASNTLGVTRTNAADGEAMPIDIMGTAVVETGGAVPAGSAIETDAQGRAVAKAAGPTVARNRHAASTAAGEFIEVLLITN